MSRLVGAAAWLRHLLGKRAADERMDEEFQFHLEMETRKHLRAGASQPEAHRRALVAFGGVDRHRERMRDGRSIPILGDVARDARHAARSLRRTPIFSLAAVLTIALGIASTTTMFTVLNAVLLRPLPVSAPERLASIYERSQNGVTRNAVSLPAYHDYQRHSSGTFAGLAAHHLSDVTLTTVAGPEVAIGMDVSGNYFDVLGIAPALGGFFSGERAERVDADQVAVISHELWRSRFASDPTVVGRSIRVNGQPLTIVGVAPRGFHGAMLGARPAVWLPIGLYGHLNPGTDITRRGMLWLQLFGRLRAGVSHDQAEAAVNVLARQIGLSKESRDVLPEGEEPVGARVDRFTTVPGNGQRSVAGFLLILLVTGALVLVIAAVNVAGMLLARGTSRRREMAIRLAMGAGRGRLVRQLLTESLLLAIAGGSLGIVLTQWASRYLTTIRPPFASSFQLDMPIDERVLGFAVLVSLVTGILFGLTPAFYTAHGDVAAAMKEGALGALRRTRLRGVLVAGQLALSLVLLVVAGLFARTLQSALRTDHGLDPDGVVAIDINLRLNGYDEAGGRVFYEQLLERVRSAPAVESAALASVIPLGFGWDQTRVRVPGHEPPPDQPGFAVGYNIVMPGYFETVRMPLLAGRDFTTSDLLGRTRAIVINRTFAERFWPGRSPVGETVRFGGDTVQIIGVVPNGKYQEVAESPRLFAYVPFGANYSHGMWLHVRPRGSAASAIASVRRELATLDPNVPPVMVTTMAAVMGSSLFPQRLAASVVGSFGAIGLFLAALGLFGLLSFSVAERTREIGVRIALGATRGQVLGGVIGEGMRLVAFGIGVGLLVAFGTTRLLGGFLHGLSPTDPLTFVAIPLVLTLVVLVAAYLPARQAAAVDPMSALRN